MNNDSITASRKFIKPISFFFLLSCTFFYAFNIFRSIFSELGISDEGFLLNQVNGRTIEGVRPWYLPFTDVLFPIWKLSGESLSIYRLCGLLLFLLFLTPSCYLLRMVGDYWRTRISILIIFTLSGLGLSRYLLVTPGYQSLILMSSVASVVPTLFLARRKPKGRFTYPIQNSLIILFLSTNLLIIASSRITGGVTYLATLMVFLCLNYGPIKSIKYLFMVGVPTAMFFIFNLNDWQERVLYSYQIAKIVDPTGYSILAEIFDLCLPLIPLSIALIIGIYTTKPYRPIKRVLILLLFFSFVVSIAVQINRVSLFLISVLVANLFNRISKLYSVKQTVSYFFVSLIPYVTVFGSNTPAAGNFHLVLIGFVLSFLALCNGEIPKNKMNLTIEADPLKPTLILLALVILIYFGMVAEKSGYEKSLTDWKLSSHRVLAESTSFEIDYLFDPLSTKGQVKNSKILDLSYFHPGIILKLGGLPYPMSLSDAKYKSNLRPQLDGIKREADRNPVHKRKFILVKLRDDSPYSCNLLSKHVQDEELASALTALPWEGDYSVAVTIALPGEVGKYGLLKPCQ
jgi:hypothetical protein